MRVFLVLVLFGMTFACASAAYVATDREWVDPFDETGEEWSNHFDDWENQDPLSISEKEFYRTEYAMLHGYSGTGGYFLDRQQIAWLSKAARSLKGRGITVRDQWRRRDVYRDAFHHLKIKLSQEIS